MGRIIVFLLISILIGINVLMINARFVLHQQLPMIGNTGFAVVLSGSMQPALNVNDLIIVQSGESYEPGDIITFTDEHNSLVTHRLVRIDTEKGTMVTKGDANNITDRVLETDRIKGRVVYILPGFGIVLNIVQNPVFVIAVVAAALFLLERSYRRQKKLRTDENEKLRAEIEKLRGESDTSGNDTAGGAEGSDTDGDTGTAENAGESDGAAEGSDADGVKGAGGRIDTILQ